MLIYVVAALITSFQCFYLGILTGIKLFVITPIYTAFPKVSFMFNCKVSNGWKQRLLMNQKSFYSQVPNNRRLNSKGWVEILVIFNDREWGGIIGVRIKGIS